MSVVLSQPPLPPETALQARKNPFTVRRLGTIEAAAVPWRKFQAEGRATVYQRLDWAGLVARHLARRHQLAVMEVADALSGRPVMLLPLVLREGRLERVAEFLDCGVCDYGAPLCAQDFAPDRQAMAAIWAALRAALGEIDRLRLVRIASAPGGRPNPLLLLPQARPMDLHAAGVALSGEAETVMRRTCSSTNARDIRRSLRRMGEFGPVRLVEARTGEEVDTLFDALVAQRLDRFRALGRFDLLLRPEVRAFYRAAARDGLHGGPVRLFGLQVGEQWAATAYGLKHGGAFHGTMIALGAEHFRRFSPGLALIGELMGWCRREGLGYFDFTIGDMPYKSGFGIERRELFEIDEALSARGLLAQQAERARLSLKRGLARHPKLFEAARSALRFGRRTLRQGRDAASADRG